MHKYMFSAENLLRYSADKIENTKQIKSKTTNKPTINTQIFVTNTNPKYEKKLTQANI